MSTSNTKQDLQSDPLSTTLTGPVKDAYDLLKETDLEVRDMCSDCNPDLITLESAPSMKEELEKINSVRNKYRKEVRLFLSNHASSITPDLKQLMDTELKELVDLVNKHKFDVLGKVNSLMSATTPMSPYEEAVISIQKQQLALQEKELENRKNEALATAQPIKDAIIEKCSDLDLELEQVSVGELATGEDHIVTWVMLKLTEWQDKLQSIDSLYQDLQVKTAVYRMADADHSAVSAAVEKTKSLLLDIKSIAEDQDIKRQLFSLDTSNRGEQIKWPTFSGEQGEDFFRFKKDFTDAAVQNKTSTRNQISKLKENIKGYAKSLIPDSITNIDRAFNILEHACGDSMKVVMYRVDKLLNVGIWPADGSRDCYPKQVRWIIKVQTLLQEIIDLANTKDELAAIIYNKEKLAQILKLFPVFIVDKLVKIPGYKEDTFKQIITKLDEFKLSSQNRELVYGSSTPAAASKDKSQINHHVPKGSTSGGHISFQKPQTYMDCRICKVLQKQGATDLFEKHVSDYPTGCPKFASMGNEQRLVVAKEARFCLKCMGNDTKYSFQHNRQCPVVTKKSSYTCNADKCFFHMWVCTKHASENKDQMEKFRDQLRTKAGIRLVYTSVMDRSFQSVENDASKVASSHSYCSKENRGIKRAVRNLHRFNKKSDPDVVTLSPPEGASVFMFFGAQGINNPVYTFFDNGCSEAIFEEGIPGNELRGTLLNKGPFKMGGVGNSSVVAEEEWLVQFNREDGKKQLVRGLTMKQITCEFPLIDTTKAEAEVKSSNPSDSILQNCRLPKMVGGKVHCLLGIQYNNIFPVPVRQLDCGLTIYKSKLLAHDTGVNALIGGPHSSFQFLADKIGNPEALLAHFVEGLRTLRQIGPPVIPSNPLSLEEEVYAKIIQHIRRKELVWESFMLF